MAGQHKIKYLRYLNDNENATANGSNNASYLISEDPDAFVDLTSETSLDGTTEDPEDSLTATVIVKNETEAPNYNDGELESGELDATLSAEEEETPETVKNQVHLYVLCRCCNELVDPSSYSEHLSLHHVNIGNIPTSEFTKTTFYINRPSSPFNQDSQNKDNEETYSNSNQESSSYNEDFASYQISNNIRSPIAYNPRNAYANTSTDSSSEMNSLPINSSSEECTVPKAKRFRACYHRFQCQYCGQPYRTEGPFLKHLNRHLEDEKVEYEDAAV